MSLQPEIGSQVTVQMSKYISAHGSFQGFDARGKAKVSVFGKISRGDLIERTGSPAPAEQISEPVMA
jgi:hypothetical protein